jgi:hypothetical protein
MVGSHRKDMIESSTNSVSMMKPNFGNVILTTTEKNFARGDHFEVVVKRGDDGDRGINFHKVI